MDIYLTDKTKLDKTEETVLKVPEGSTVTSLLSIAGLDSTTLFVVNDKVPQMDMPLERGDRVLALPPISGG